MEAARGMKPTSSSLLKPNKPLYEWNGRCQRSPSLVLNGISGCPGAQVHARECVVVKRTRCASVHACVRACVGVCTCACVRARVCACLYARVYVVVVVKGWVIELGTCMRVCAAFMHALMRSSSSHQPPSTVHHQPPPYVHTPNSTHHGCTCNRLLAACTASVSCPGASPCRQTKSSSQCSRS